MKHSKKILFYAAILAGFYFTGRLLEGQTLIAPRNLANPITGGIVYVIGPDGRTAFARLDASLQLTADASGFLTLKAAAATVSDRVVVFKPTTAGTTITLPSAPQGNSLQIASNGFVLTPTEDYNQTPNGLLITFVPRWVPQPGDIVQARYRE